MQSFALTVELEQAVGRCSPERRGTMLLQIIDLFLKSAPRFSEPEIALFDEVITRLAVHIEVAVREKLAVRLAPYAKAPFNITRILANDDEIRVAAPVLTQSTRLDDSTLMDIARKKGEPYLLAIAQRQALSETLTDILVERGMPAVMAHAATNAGAKFSYATLVKLVGHPRNDETLASVLADRTDLPRPLMATLIDIASARVRSKLIAVNPHMSAVIADAVDAVGTDFRKSVSDDDDDYAAAQALVHSLLQAEELNDDAVRGFVEAGKLPEIIAALSQLCDIPLQVIEQSIKERQETLLIMIRAAGLSRLTAKSLLSLPAIRQNNPASDIDQAMAGFDRLNLESAQQILKFYRLQRFGVMGVRASPRSGLDVKAMGHSAASIEHPLVSKRH